MAVSLLAHEVSDLCIGKPALRPLTLSSTVGDALLSLKAYEDSYLSVWTTASSSVSVSPPEKKANSSCVGKVCLVDVICYLCSEDNVGDPFAALKAPVSVLLIKGSSGLVRRVEPHSSIVEALDLILDGALNLVVPIHPSPRKRKLPQGGGGAVDFCCLTQEDFVRFFLNSIGLFSPIPSLSIEDLGLICPDVLAVRYHAPALSAVPLIKQAVATQTAVAVITDDGKLIGEISPSTLSICSGRGGDEAVAGAVAALSVGELMTYIDCGSPPEEAVRAVKARLMEKGLKGLLELMEEETEDDEEEEVLSRSSSSLSSSSDEEMAAMPEKKKWASPGSRRYSRSGSYSARMGRRSEEAIVCHPGSSLMAAMVQALAHRVSYVWVVEDDYELAGVVTFPEILSVFREHLAQQQQQ